MNRSINKSTISLLRAVSAVALTLVITGARAQDITTTSVRHGESTNEYKVRNAEIVYVEGNDLVVKLEDGKVEHMIVPPDEKFSIDGREVTVSDLKPGTKLTQTITTTTTPRYVNSVRTLKGKVWHVNAPSNVILQLPDHTMHRYQVPSHAEFIINGRRKTVFDLRKGMKIEATIVRDDPQTVVEVSRSTVGEAPAPELPPLFGMLLIQTMPSLPEVASNVTAEHVDPPTLPETASSVPLFGLLGLLGVASSLGLGAVRKLVNLKA